jgi:hypothetical protein
MVDSARRNPCELSSIILANKRFSVHGVLDVVDRYVDNGDDDVRDKDVT